MSESDQVSSAKPKASDSDAAAETRTVEPVKGSAKADDKTHVTPRINEPLATGAAKPADDKTTVTPKVAADLAAGDHKAAGDKTRVNPTIAADLASDDSSLDKTEVTKATGPTRDRTGRVKTTSSGAVRPARKARLRIAKLDPWSVMKTALMFSVAAAIILFVAVALLWSVIEASGALDTLQETLNSLLGNPDGGGTFEIESVIDRWRVLGFTAIVCGINVVLLTALATLGAFLYNLSSSVLGGLDVTLAED